MPDEFAKVEITGVKELMRELRKLGDKDIPKAIKAANRAAAEEVVPEAKAQVPVVSGKLQRSIKARGSQRSGSVKAGSAQRVPYAGPIHFGWWARHIPANKFLYRAINSRASAAFATYQKAMELVIARFNART